MITCLEFIHVKLWRMCRKEMKTPRYTMIGRNTIIEGKMNVVHLPQFLLGIENILYRYIHYTVDELLWNCNGSDRSDV